MQDIQEQTPAPETTEEHPAAHRPIRSFVLRQGHLSNGQAKALETYWPLYGIDYRPENLDLEAAFGRQAPKILEIGFGMGQATAHIAAHAPDKDFLGLEVHTPGVGSLLKLLGEQSIQNVRVIQHDAVEVVKNMIAPNSLDGIHIFFPDPWHKKRHNKRRLIQSPFVELLASRLKVGGYFHAATDWEDYAIQILEVCQQEPSLSNRSQGYADKPDYRPLTKFEARGLRLGHGVWDIVFHKNA